MDTAPQHDPYWRRARLVRVIDGDTFLAELSLGYYLSAVVHLRLLGLDTPELHDHDPFVRAAALAAKVFAEGWFREHLHDLTAPDDWPLLVRTLRSDSFGRWLADVWCQQGHHLNADLLDGGYAVPFMVAKG